MPTKCINDSMQQLNNASFIFDEVSSTAAKKKLCYDKITQLSEVKLKFKIIPLQSAEKAETVNAPSRHFGKNQSQPLLE